MNIINNLLSIVFNFFRFSIKYIFNMVYSQSSLLIIILNVLNSSLLRRFNHLIFNFGFLFRACNRQLSSLIFLFVHLFTPSNPTCSFQYSNSSKIAQFLKFVFSKLKQKFHDQSIIFLN